MQLRRRRGEGGVQIVELAITLSVLLLILFGIIEFGLLMRTYITVLHAAREGARAAALGATTSNIINRVQNSAPGLSLSMVELKYSTDATPDWGAAPRLGNNGAGTENNAPVGSLVRVHVTYNYRFLTRYLLGGLKNKVFTLDMVMRREGTPGAPAAPGAGNGGVP